MGCIAGSTPAVPSEAAPWSVVPGKSALAELLPTNHVKKNKQRPSCKQIGLDTPARKPWPCRVTVTLSASFMPFPAVVTVMGLWLCGSGAL